MAKKSRKSRKAKKAKRSESFGVRVRLWIRNAQHELRNILLTGLIVLVPLTVTVWLFTVVVGWMDGWIGLVPSRFRPENVIGFKIPGLEAVLLVLLILAVGVFARNYFGKKILAWGEGMLGRVPFISKVYAGAKQILETALQRDGMHFRKVVLIEYPRRGLYCLAFLTGRPGGEIQERTGEEVINVFLPTTPNPTSGFLLMVPRKDAIELEMSIETAFRVIISGGMIDDKTARQMTPEERDKVKPLRAAGDA